MQEPYELKEMERKMREEEKALREWMSKNFGVNQYNILSNLFLANASAIDVLCNIRNSGPTEFTQKSDIQLIADLLLKVRRDCISLVEFVMLLADYVRKAEDNCYGQRP
jgi:hypothetical protein